MQLSTQKGQTSERDMKLAIWLEHWTRHCYACHMAKDDMRQAKQGMRSALSKILLDPFGRSCDYAWLVRPRKMRGNTAADSITDVLH